MAEKKQRELENALQDKENEVAQLQSQVKSHEDDIQQFQNQLDDTIKAFRDQEIQSQKRIEQLEAERDIVNTTCFTLWTQSYIDGERFER